ncbi:MAG: winged helix-turn-helix domain-containing protein [Streptosporangiaceae bacterium]
MRALDLSRQKTRPMHPRADPKAQAAFVKGGSAPIPLT